MPTDARAERAPGRRRGGGPAVAATILAVLAGCAAGPQREAPTHAGRPPDQAAAGQPRGLAQLEPAYRFDRPIDVAFPPTGGMLVAERGGRVLLVRDGAEPAAFLDLRDRLDRLGSEDGLRGIALAPTFAADGVFYIRYQLPFPRRTILARLRADGPDHAAAAPGSEETLLEVPHGFQHRPGGLAFGPDGFLYVGLGDGEEGPVPSGVARDDKQLLGKVLRLDVGVASLDRPYGIPPENPHDGDLAGKRGEIFARGFHNPRQLSFDEERLWVVDSAGDRLQEIDMVAANSDYGWPVMAADRCWRRARCLEGRYRKPAGWYDRSWGEALVGGCVYRGARFPALAGRYVYADAASGRVGVLPPGGGPGRTLVEGGPAFTTVARRPDGEPVFAAADGRVYALE